MHACMPGPARAESGRSGAWRMVMLSIELGSSHVRACQPCSMLELGVAAAAVASSVAVGQPPPGCSGVCRPWQRQRSSRLTSSPGYSLNIRGTCSAARLDIAARAVAVACADRRPPPAFPAAGQGAFGNMCRGGHMYAPTKVWRRWHRKINVNQKRCAGWRCWGCPWLGGASTGLPGTRQECYLPACLLTALPASSCRAGTALSPRFLGTSSHAPRLRLPPRTPICSYAVVSAIAASALPALVMARGHKIEAVPEVPLVVSDAAGELGCLLASIVVVRDACCMRFGAVMVPASKSGRASCSLCSRVHVGIGRTRELARSSSAECGLRRQQQAGASMQSGAGSQELDRRAGPCDDEQRLSPGCGPLTQRSSMTTGLAGDSRHGVNPAGCRQQAAHSCCGCSVFLGGTCLLPRLPELPCLPQFAHLAPPGLSSCPAESITKTKAGGCASCCTHGMLQIAHQPPGLSSAPQRASPRPSRRWSC